MFFADVFFVRRYPLRLVQGQCQLRDTGAPRREEGHRLGAREHVCDLLDRSHPRRHARAGGACDAGGEGEGGTRGRCSGSKEPGQKQDFVLGGLRTTRFGQICTKLARAVAWSGCR